ncbi:cell division protein FtsH, partial [Candidatus Aerophobetes bacterium]
MSDDKNKPEQKRKLPGGFLIFLLAAVLIILLIQNFTGDKGGRVSFSHQVEHLVNLDLLDKDSSKKTALNDNLVTFSGKFKENLTEDSKSRFRYLELLNRNHELAHEKKRLAEDLSVLEKNVVDSGVLFLQISAISIPKGGYNIIGPYYDSLERESSISIKRLPVRDIVSIKDVENLYRSSMAAPIALGVDALGKDLSLLIQHFRSPTLGIGSESLKTEL